MCYLPLLLIKGLLLRTNHMIDRYTKDLHTTAATTLAYNTYTEYRTQINRWKPLLTVLLLLYLL
jgi:hypothetical protein